MKHCDKSHCREKGQELERWEEVILQSGTCIILVMSRSLEKWTGMGEFHSDDHYWSLTTIVGKNPLEEME